MVTQTDLSRLYEPMNNDLSNEEGIGREIQARPAYCPIRARIDGSALAYFREPFHQPEDRSAIGSG
jgi:hypothetical protein